MKNRDAETTQSRQGESPASPVRGTSKQPWQDPKLTFVEPKLTKHGAVAQITAQEGFFGTFTPEGVD